MAVTGVEVVCSPENDPTGGTSTSFTCTITAGKLYILQVWADDTDGSGVEFPTSVTAGAGRAFTKIDDHSLLTGWAGASSWRMCPTTGGAGVSFTISFATARGTTMWRMLELDGTAAVAADNGAAAIIQHVERTSSNTAAAVTFTLAAFADANNACVMGDTCYRDGSNISSTGSTGFTEIVDDNFLIEGSFRAHMSFYVRTTAVTNPQITLNANVANNFGWALEVATASGGAAQEITGNLFSNSNSFFAAQINHTVAANLFTDTDQFFASQINRSINANLFTDGDTFFTSTVIRGQFINGALFTDSDTFHAATITQGGAPQQITAALFSDTDTFHTATLQANYTITGSLYSDDDLSFGATVSVGTAIIAAELYSDPDSFSTASVVASYSISANLFTNVNTFNVATVTTSYTINAALHNDADTFFAADIIGTQLINAQLFTNVNTFSTASVVQQQFILGGLYADPDTFFSADIFTGGVPDTGGGLVPLVRRRRRC